MYYEKSYSFRTTDFDCNDKIRISALLDIFQYVAGLHAQQLGVGFEAMIKQGYYWVISKIEFDILENVAVDEDVIVATWPVPPSRAEFFRNCILKDKNGKIIVTCRTAWIVITEDRKIVRPEKVLFNSTNYFLETLYNESMNKLNYDLPLKCDKKSHLVVNSDIDHNGHMNNSKYGDLILDFWNKENQIGCKKFLISFHHEAFKDDIINTYQFTDGDSDVYIGMVDKVKCFTAKVRMEEKK